MKKFFVAAILLFAFSIAACADILLETPKPTPAPKQAKAIDTRLYISISKDTKEARLVIPKSQLKQLRAELDQLDESNPTLSFNFSRTQTVVSGLFLSLAFVFAGVWFARSQKSESKTGKALAVGSILFLSGMFATIAFANVGPPNEARSITGKIFTNAVHQYKQASGRIKLETSDQTDEIELIVPDVARENNSDE
jgi:hypothetical protein